MLPLEGITVVSLEHAIAAPFATRQLADLGARVIKVERPGVGDFARNYDTRVNGLASHFVWANRSKESLSLDVKSKDGACILSALIADADVLVQNLAPGAAARLGLNYEALKPKNPGLIVCNISGFGSDGPQMSRKAYDLLIQAESGFLSTTGTEDAPSKAGISVADIAAGMYAYSNILAALLRRQKTGHGCSIDLSMLEAMSEWMSFPLYYAFDGAEPPKRAGASHATIFPYGPFQTGDGQTIILGLQNEREWLTFCQEVLRDEKIAKDPRFASNSLRAEHKNAITAIIEQNFAQATIDAVSAALDTAGIANARMNTMNDLWDHEQLKARKRWRRVQSPAGAIPALLPPGGIGVEPKMEAVPDLGEHTAKVLYELGYSKEAVADFRNRKVI